MFPKSTTPGALTTRLDAASSTSLRSPPHDEGFAFPVAGAPFGARAFANEHSTMTETSTDAALVDRLRAELAAQEDKSVQALLLHECAVAAERRGEEPAAARDYLASFNADPQFREPL